MWTHIVFWESGKVFVSDFVVKTRKYSKYILTGPSDHIFYFDLYMFIVVLGDSCF